MPLRAGSLKGGMWGSFKGLWGGVILGKFRADPYEKYMASLL